MLTPIDMKEWEKTCREKTGLGFETFKTVTHCDAETLDALLEAASGSIKEPCISIGSWSTSLWRRAAKTPM